MSYLLDTNFIVGLLRGAAAYSDHLDELLGRTLPSISAISRAEIFAGCHPAEQRKTERLLDSFPAVPVDASTADLAGQYVYRFARRGITLHLEDALIGATVVQEGLILVTRNVRHFPMLVINRNLTCFPNG